MQDHMGTLPEGTRVSVKPGKEHDAMTKGKVGTILQISTPALGIKFDGMPGIHKWYTEAELTTVASAMDDSEMDDSEMDM